MPATIQIDIDDSVLVKLIAATKGKRPVRIVADGVEYGKYVEFGTSRMAPRPAAKQAAEAIRPGYIKAIGQVENWEKAEAVTEKAARDMERKWKQGIRDMRAIDTGAYINSVHVIKGGR
jgi:hypothetical protein